MARLEKLVLMLPNEAAAKLKELAKQQHKTVTAFVANVVDDWLEIRRRDVRLGKTKYQEALLRVETGADTGLRG
jgi:hypothetical protein